MNDIASSKITVESGSSKIHRGRGRIKRKKLVEVIILVQVKAAR
jgi:hypothetical protein